MAGQGQTTKAYAEELNADGWKIIYTCIPNTPHLGVIAIPIASSTKQHYPDVLAFKGGITKLVEVELQLSPDVARKIAERFSEMIDTLSREEAWLSFSTHIRDTTGHCLPSVFVADCELVVCAKPKPSLNNLIDNLSSRGVRILFRDRD